MVELAWPSEEVEQQYRIYVILFVVLGQSNAAGKHSAVMDDALAKPPLRLGITL